MGNKHTKSTYATPTHPSVTRTLRIEVPPHINNRYMDDCDASQYSGLTADEARDMALQWLPELETDVGLQLKMTQNGSFTPACDRLWFAIRRNHHVSAAIVRATAIVWALIAQCPGYSVEGNPEFWRRILTTVAAPLRYVPMAGVVFGPVALYPRNCSLFPRIGITVSDVHSLTMEMEVWRIVCGIHEYPFEAVQATLDGILGRLVPHTRQHGTPTVDVAIMEMSHHEVTQSPSTLNRCEQPELAPRFHVSEVTESEDRVSERARIAVVDASRRELARPRETQHFDEKPSELAQHVVIDRPIPDGWILRENQNYDDLMALCSSLPFTSSTLTSIRYQASRPESNKFEVPWLLYAIFHPDAINGSVTKLNLRLDWTQVRVLTHSEVPFHDGRHQSVRYFDGALADLVDTVYRPRRVYKQVFLAAGTVLRKSPHENGIVILTLPDTTHAELLKYIPRTDRGWRNVIVRSIGSCWVQAQGIVGPVRRRRALKKPGLSELTIDWRPKDSSFSILPSRFTHAVLRFSGNLTKLDIASVSWFSSSAIKKILKANPLLKSFAVKHDGSVWRDEGSLWHKHSKWPRLEELKLVIDIRYGDRYYAPSENSITTGSLQNLRIFVAILARESIFDENQHEFVRLINTHRKLSFVAVSPQDITARLRERDYAQWKYVSEQRLLAAGVMRQILLGHSDRSTKAIVLMSVIRRLLQQQQLRRGEASALGAFGSDVMKCVLSFTGKADARVVWFGPWPY